MSVKQELIRWIFGTLAAPAFIQNLMSKFDIGISGSSDRTRFIVKDNFGVEHRFITQDEVQSLIDSGVASLSGVYTIANDEASFRTLVASEPLINIWYNGPALVDTGSINVVSSKNIYGADNESLEISANTTFAFPTSSATNDIKIRLFNGCNNESGFFLISGGGYSGNGGYTFVVQTTSVYKKIIESSFVPVEYEINKDSAVTEDGSLALWSGQHTQGKAKDETWSKRSPKALSVITKQDNDVKDVATTSTEYNSTSVDISENGGASWVQKFKTFLIDINPSFDVNWGMDLSSTTALRVLRDNNWGKIIMGLGTEAYSWLNAYAFDVGPNGWAAYKSTTAAGDAQNAYLDDTTWRAKGNGYCRRIEQELSTGDIVEYSTATSIAPNDPCNFVERKRTDKSGNVGHNGAPIPSGIVNHADLHQEFWPSGKGMATAIESGSARTFDLQNTYISGFTTVITEWKARIAGFCEVSRYNVPTGETQVLGSTISVSADGIISFSVIGRTEADGTLHLPFAPVIDL
jgi:hypothetical protein